jgi:hypothetical protein
MHHCLLIHELACHICSEIRNMGAQKSLAALAQTCLSLSEPALDALWYELHDIVPLVQCMPRDLWMVSYSANRRRSNLVRSYPSIHSHRGSPCTKRLQRSILPTDWERFTHHARRVRIFIFEYASGVGNVFQALSLGTMEELLLPNLRELKWALSRDEAAVFPCIHLFLGPHITRLHMPLHWNMDIQLSLFRILSVRYPSLTHFHLLEDSKFEHSSLHLDTISQVVCGWNRLRQLTVCQLSTEALYHVALLPTLEVLALAKVTGDIPVPFSRSSTAGFFPCLQELTVVCELVSFAIGLVKAMSSSPLTSVTIVSETAMTSGYQDVINVLRDCCSFSLLKSVYIGEDGEDEPVTRSVDLRPLFAFSNLTDVALYSYASLGLDDNSLKEIAQAWSHITCLEIDGGGVDEQPRVTLSGLVPLAQYCLRLQKLTIRLDARSVPPPTTESSGVTHRSLKALWVLDSPITEPARVAAFIDDIFPDARVSFSQWSNNDTKEKWHEVCRILLVRSRDGIVAANEA